jgi:hypothetical protein
MIRGSLVTLRPAVEQDRRAVYDWMANPDVAASMMGPPLFPEHPVPTWEEFCADYLPHFFDGSRPDLGRSFIIEVNGEPVGHINYNDIDSGTSITTTSITSAGAPNSTSGCGRVKSAGAATGRTRSRRWRISFTKHSGCANSSCYRRAGTRGRCGRTSGPGSRSSR